MPQRFSPVRNTQAPDEARANVMRSPLARGSWSGVNFSPPPSAGSWRAQSTSFNAACEAASTPMSQSPRQQSPQLWQVKTTPSARRSGCGISVSVPPCGSAIIAAVMTTTPGGRAVATRLFVVLLLGVLIALPIAVYADTLDPTWEGGFWDDDDFDAVILLVTNLEASVPAVLSTLAPTINVVGVVPAALGDAPFIECRLSFRRRGPPPVA